MTNDDKLELVKFGLQEIKDQYIDNSGKCDPITRIHLPELSNTTILFVDVL